jgi:hypothetical protein
VLPVARGPLRDLRCGLVPSAGLRAYCAPGRACIPAAGGRGGAAGAPKKRKAGPAARATAFELRARAASPRISPPPKERLAQLAALGAQVQGGQKAVGARKGRLPADREPRQPARGAKKEGARGRGSGSGVAYALLAKRVCVLRPGTP